MYESHFSLSGPPFNLSPDPAFYFGSRGHSTALSYLKFGVFQGEGFIVVTGDIGAGKTTLLRTLLGDLDSAKVLAAQIVSTQLEPGDLLRAVALAFGIATKGLSKADLIGTIEAGLTLLATQQRRALLIVDEAQNLSPDAIEELRMLSNFQLGNRALLQSFLVGQPELRKLLLSPSMEQFRQRVIASCHLGPLGAAETRGYIEHRLQLVGWQDRPHFDGDAFGAIHRWTGGVPRRINLLCNRLLLDCFLAGREAIDAAQVDGVAREIRAEMGETGGEPPMPEPEAKVPPAAPAAREDSAAPVPRPAVGRSAIRLAPKVVAPLLGVVDTATDDLQMAALLHELAGSGKLPPAHCVRLGKPDDYAHNESFRRKLGLAEPLASLGAAAGLTADCIQRFERVVVDHRPSCIVLPGSSDMMLACALVANKTGTSLVWVDDGARSISGQSSELTNRRLIARLADLIYTSEAAPLEALRAEGIASERLQHVGPLLIDAAQAALARRWPAGQALRRLVSGAPLRAAAHEGYGLVSIRHAFQALDPRALAVLLAALTATSRELPLLLSIDPRIRAGLDRSGLGEQLDLRRMALLPTLGYEDHIALLDDARCLITDSASAQQEATALGVCCFSSGAGEVSDLTVQQGSNRVTDFTPEGLAAAVADMVRGGGKRGTIPDLWDGQAARRIAAHLETWNGGNRNVGGAAKKAAA